MTSEAQARGFQPVWWTAPSALSSPLFSGCETGNDDIYKSANMDLSSVFRSMSLNDKSGKSTEEEFEEEEFEEEEFEVHGHYKIYNHPIGKGSFGTVHYSKHIKTQKSYATKVIDIGPDCETTEEEAEKEASIGKLQLQHDHIIEVVEYWVERSLKFYMIMEYYANGTLTQAIKRQKHLPHRWRWMYQLCDGLNYMHKSGIAHCDFRSDNILIDSEYCVKICDFGNARSLTKSHSNSKVQNPVNTACNAFNVQGDMIALGRIYFELCSDICEVCHGKFHTDDPDKAARAFADSSVTPKIEEHMKNVLAPLFQLLKSLMKGEFSELPEPKQKENIDLDRDLFNESPVTERSSVFLMILILGTGLDYSKVLLILVFIVLIIVYVVITDISILQSNEFRKLIAEAFKEHKAPAREKIKEYVTVYWLILEMSRRFTSFHSV